MEMEANKLAVKEFELDTMCKYPLILIIGKRGSGRELLGATLLNHMLQQYMNNTTDTYIFSPTEKENPFYSLRYPSTNIEHAYNLDTIEKIITESSKTECSKDKIILFDNCFFNHNPYRNNILYDMIMNGKDYRCTIIIIVSTSFGIPIEISTN